VRSRIFERWRGIIGTVTSRYEAPSYMQNLH
jgi:hypothetical protein